MDPGDLAAIITAGGTAVAAIAAASYQVSQTLKARAEREAIERGIPERDAADHELLQTVVRDLGLVLMDMAQVRAEQLDQADQIREIRATLPQLPTPDPSIPRNEDSP